jgi:hypothetical protein
MDGRRMMQQRSSRGAVAVLAVLACRDPAGDVHRALPFSPTAVVAGVVTGPGGGGVPAAMVYVSSDYTSACGAAAKLLGFMRTDGEGRYEFRRVTAPVEQDSVCVRIVVRPEPFTGLMDSPAISAYVDFRSLGQPDTAYVDVALTP